MTRLNHLDLLDARAAVLRTVGGQIARCDDIDAREALVEVLLIWSRWSMDVSVSTDWTGPLDFMEHAFDHDEARTPEHPDRPHGTQRLIAECMWAAARDLVALDTKYL